MLKNLIQITTDDTHATYELPSEDTPQLWEATLLVACVNPNTGQPSPRRVEATIHIERQTLVNAGCVPAVEDDKEPAEEEKDTAESLLLRLLEHVGFYPTE